MHAHPFVIEDQPAAQDLEYLEDQNAYRVTSTEEFERL